jgi:ribose transport system ATP-binding protein
MPPAAPVLSMEAIEKRFGSSVALDGVNLVVRRGEVHALIGENGAGKSTLMKILSGAYLPDAGRMTLDGRPYAPRDPLDAQRLGIAMIYQELTLAVHLTVEQNIVLGREPRRHGLVDRGAMRASVARALEWLDQPELHPERVVADLSPGARQLVEVARALVTDAKVVVMDEPTSSLSKPESERLFAVIDRLRDRGVAVVYISHFLEEVRRVAQRYTVLRDGRTVETADVPRSTTTEREESFISHAIEAMAGRSLDAAFPHVPHEPGEVVLEIEDLAGPRLPRRAGLALRRGEIFGIAGLVGAGRTEFLRALFGLDAVRSGRVRIGGVWDSGRAPWERLEQGVGLLSENRKEEGLALGLSISDNLTLSRPVATLGVISRAAHERATAGAAGQLGLRYRDARQSVGELSGGNQQKVALGRLLHHDIDVFLFDEPTRGIDVSSKAEIYRIMGQLAQRGKSIVFVSSYLPELLGVCDRIAVMSRGWLHDARPVGDWTEHSLLEAATAAFGRAQAAPSESRGAGERG